jgi:hypothetical protein
MKFAEKLRNRAKKNMFDMVVMKLVAAFVVAWLGLASAFASTIVVDFNPAAPANTNGWNFGETTANDTAASTKKGGRKFDPAKGESFSIESPVNVGRILSVALSAWGNGINTGNTSKLEIFGRASENDEYQLLFSRTTLANKASENEKADKVSIVAEVDCHQIKISYTKDIGSWVLSTVTIIDDTIAAETPTDVQIISTDAEQKSATVGWNLADGLTTSEYQTFTTTTTGGFSDLKSLWRETFDKIPALADTSTKMSDSKMSEFGLENWEHEIAYQTKNAGAIVVGWKAKTGGILQEGFIVTPPLGLNLSSGHELVVRAKKEETTSGGNLPIYKISGNETNLIQEVEITSALADYVISLPEISASDKLLFHSSTVTNVTNRKTLIDDIAICEAGVFKPETISTNDFSEIQTITTNAVSLVVPGGNTNLYFQVRTKYDGKESEWSDPILVSLSSDGTGDGKTDEGDGEKESGGESGGDTGGETAKITAPENPRVGSLPDGKFRIGWETPDAATNVHLRIWTLSQVGGISESSTGDILWCETFAGAPATNTAVRIDNENKFDLYTDKKSDGWNVSHCVQVWISPEEKSVRIGTSDKPGALESNSLNLNEDNLTLVVKAKRGTGEKNSGVVLHAAVLSNSGMTTNEIGTAAMTENYSEYSFAISDALIGMEKLLLTSEIASPKDGRIILDDIFLVKNYTPVTTVTNEFISADFSDEEEYDFSPEPNTIYYAALCAQDANGETSEWTETLVLDPEKIEIWKDHHLTLDNHGKASATLDISKIYDAKKTELDVSDEPFRFLIDDAERLEITNNKNVEKVKSYGIYVCTNIFERDWIVLVPKSAETKGVAKTAEMRVAIETETFAARKISITGTFAQLDTKNTATNALLFQWRWIPKEGEETDWIDFGSYETQYVASDTSPDLEETIETVTAEAMLRLPEERTWAPVGARIEVRVLNQKFKDQKVALMGFRDFTISAEKPPSALIIIIQ